MMTMVIFRFRSYLVYSGNGWLQGHRGHRAIFKIDLAYTDYGYSGYTAILDSR